MQLFTTHLFFGGSSPETQMKIPFLRCDPNSSFQCGLPDETKTLKKDSSVNLRFHSISPLLTRKLTPRNINMEPENDGLVQMIFLFNWVIFRIHVNLPRCTSPSIDFLLEKVIKLHFSHCLEHHPI